MSKANERAIQSTEHLGFDYDQPSDNEVGNKAAQRAVGKLTSSSLPGRRVFFRPGHGAKSQ
jgi:hypothetical protein